MFLLIIIGNSHQHLTDILEITDHSSFFNHVINSCTEDAWLHNITSSGESLETCALISYGVSNFYPIGLPLVKDLFRLFSPISIVMCQIFTPQDYHWWWRSFLLSGSCSVYVFLYAIFYYVTKVTMKQTYFSVKRTQNCRLTLQTSNTWECYFWFGRDVIALFFCGSVILGAA